MAEPKWTPGPWRKEGLDRADQPLVLSDPTSGRLVAVCCHECVDEEGAHANAHLIAAAPELYSVANEAPVLSQYHGQHGFEVERFIADYEAWGTKRRIVLAKARGD